MIDINKKYKTKNGYSVEILKVGLKGRDFSVVVISTGDDGNENCCFYTSEGYYFTHKRSEWDLVEVKPMIKQGVWLNVYNTYDTYCATYNSKDDADTYSRTNRLACVKVSIDCEEGEGL